MIQLCPVENSRGLGNACQVKGLYKLVERKDLLLRQLALGRPAQQRHIVENGISEIALRLQILVAGIAVALGLLFCASRMTGEQWT